MINTVAAVVVAAPVPIVKDNVNENNSRLSTSTNQRRNSR